jgi:hypothetical protein
MNPTGAAGRDSETLATLGSSRPATPDLPVMTTRARATHALIATPHNPYAKSESAAEVSRRRFAFTGGPAAFATGLEVEATGRQWSVSLGASLGGLRRFGFRETSRTPPKRTQGKSPRI